MRQQGYTVFVIRGSLPRPQVPSHPGLAGPGRWFTVEEVGAGWAGAADAMQAGCCNVQMVIPTALCLPVVHLCLVELVILH
jgi:hypothetical protein